jgi:predicted DNA binding CopG/RHH family protein
MMWRPVVGYEDRYEVSDAGSVRKSSGQEVRQYKNHNGYMLVRLSGPRKEVRVHRVVAAAFISNPRGLPFVNHIDCDRANNKHKNLEWCTQWENLAHSRKLGRMQTDYWSGKRSPNAALSNETVKAIRNEYARGGISWQALAKKYGSNKRTVGRIVCGETYV